MAFNSNGNNFNNFNNNFSNGNNDMLSIDDVITDEPKEFNFVLLKPGEYPFTVKNAKVEVHQGSGAMNGFQKFALDLEVHGVDHEGKEATAIINDSLFLSKKTAWKIASFLACVGLKNHGEPIALNKVLNSVGEKGTVKVENQEAMNGKTNDKGELLVYNNIAAYIVPSGYYGK